MLRRPGALERLAAALAGADRVVLLGDTLELRERPAGRSCSSVVRPLFERLAPALAGKRVTLVPGNHDHQLGRALARPRLRLAGRPLGSENEWPVDAGRRDGAAGVLASWLPRSEVTLAYPGLRLDDGIYATHGQYLDLYLTVPRVESIDGVGGLPAQRAARRVHASADDFEAVMAPDLRLPRRAGRGRDRRRAGARGDDVALGLDAGRPATAALGRLLVGRVTIPAAVAALNRLRIGPFSADADRRGAAPRRPARDGAAWPTRSRPTPSTCCSATRTGPGRCRATTRRSGARCRGTRLWNSGNWYLESAFVAAGRAQPLLAGHGRLDRAGPAAADRERAARLRRRPGPARAPALPSA